MQTGTMRIPRSAWPARRVVTAAITLVMLLLAFAAHPPALEAVALPLAQLTHIHDQGSKDAGALAHQVLHHDHHFEMISQQAIDIVGVKDRPIFVAHQDDVRIAQITFDRPPRSA